MSRSFAALWKMLSMEALITDMVADLLSHATRMDHLSICE
jgi:hypothetical protein